MHAANAHLITIKSQIPLYSCQKDKCSGQIITRSKQIKRGEKIFAKLQVKCSTVRNILTKSGSSEWADWQKMRYMERSIKSVIMEIFGAQELLRLTKLRRFGVWNRFFFVSIFGGGVQISIKMLAKSFPPKFRDFHGYVSYWSKSTYATLEQYCTSWRRRHE